MRHGTRVPTLSQLQDFYFSNTTNWTTCELQFPGVSLTPLNESTGQPWNTGITPIPRDLPNATSPVPPPGGPCYQEWLTQDGFQLAQKTGAQLRRRYLGSGAQHVLPETWNPAAIMPSLWLHADNLQRTLNTLRGVLGGLWPAAAAAPGGGNFTVMLDENTTDYLAMYCPYLMQAGGFYPTQTALVNAEMADYPEGLVVAQQVTQRMLLTPNYSTTAPPYDWTNLYDVLESFDGNRMPPPVGLTPALYRSINHLDTITKSPMEAPNDATCLLANTSACADLIRGTIGPLLYRLTCNMRRVAGGPQCTTNYGVYPPAANPRFMLYAGHDTTIVNLRTVLGLPAELWPPYCDHMAFELWEERAGRLTVRVRYQGRYVKLGGLGRSISVEQFEALVQRWSMTTARKVALCSM